MNESELQAKVDELLALVKSTHARSIVLEQQVVSLKADVAKLNERLTYREKVLVGWKEIATYLGFSQFWAQHLMNGTDPLPISREGKSVVARASALDAWKSRHADHLKTPGKKSKVVIREKDEPVS
jgi:hypothetical protein